MLICRKMQDAIIPTTKGIHHLVFIPADKNSPCILRMEDLVENLGSIQILERLGNEGHEVTT